MPRNDILLEFRTFINNLEIVVVDVCKHFTDEQFCTVKLITTFYGVDEILSSVPIHNIVLFIFFDVHAYAPCFRVDS